MKRIVLWFMQWREDEALQEEVIDYLTKERKEKVEAGEKPQEYLEERKTELRGEMDSLREEIAERFISRSKYYLLTSIVLLVIYVSLSGCLTIISPRQFGALVGLMGSIILGFGLIQGTYKLFGILAGIGFGSPTRYFKRQTINDTTDGIWGVSYLIVGFGIQLFEKYVPVLFPIC